MPTDTSETGLSLRVPIWVIPILGVTGCCHRSSRCGSGLFSRAISTTNTCLQFWRVRYLGWLWSPSSGACDRSRIGEVQSRSLRPQCRLIHLSSSWIPIYSKTRSHAGTALRQQALLQQLQSGSFWSPPSRTVQLWLRLCGDLDCCDFF